MNPVYLDYAATTPVDPAVAEHMAGFLTLDGCFANPASRSHKYGWLAEQAVEAGRRQLADLLGADCREIVFTSGATEADNLAIKGVAQAFERRRGQPGHLVASAYEHKAVLDTCAFLAQQGWSVTYIQPDRTGVVSPDMVARAIRDDTALVSIMHVNNELGALNDIAAIGAACREREVSFHVDAAQSVGKVALDLATLPVDLLSVSAHKFYGPKGAGALFVRRRAGLEVDAQMHGGGHEQGYRSGTLPTHQIAGMGMAAQLAARQLEQDDAHVRQLSQRFMEGLADLENIKLNGGGAKIPHILNLRFEGMDGETLLMALNRVACSSGSACNSADVAPSFVLKAIGLTDAQALSSLRFSFGRFTTEEDVDTAVGQIREVVQRLA